MGQEKKPKVDDVEKLRKILDNPSDPNNKKLIASDDKILDSVRKRLLFEAGVISTRTSVPTTRMSLSLEPTVTVHPHMKPVPVTKPATPLPEFIPVPVSQVFEQPIIAEEPFIEMQDLIEIEKVETTYPEFSEVGPSNVLATQAEMTRQPGEEATPTAIDRNLPEWQPVDETQPSEPVPTEKPSVHHEEQLVEEIPEFERLESTMIQPETIEKPIAWEPATISGPTREPQPELPEFHPFEPQGQPQELSRQQGRAQKKAEKQKEKETKRQKKIELKKLKIEARQKEKEAKRLTREQQPTIEPSSEIPPLEPAPIVEQPPPIKVDLSAFKGIESIDGHTGELLYRNGYFSLDNLRDATIDDLVQIRGIKRKLAKKIKKEIEQKTTSKPQEEEFVPIKKRVRSKKPREEPEDATEWESFSVNNSEETLSTTTVATQGKYTLYKKEIGKGAKKTTIHFFSKQKPATGTPVPVPEGYRIAVNKKTKIPYLKKKK